MSSSGGWLDRVAEAVVAGEARVAAPRTVRLVETNDGQLTAQASDISMPEFASDGQLRVDEGKIVAVGSNIALHDSSLRWLEIST